MVQLKFMRGVFKILQYLKRSSRRGLYFKKTTGRQLEIYTNTDWAGSLADQRSTTRYFTFVWGNMVTWRIKKQSVIPRSSAEAEFRAMSQGICQGMWLERLLRELTVPMNNSMIFLCDNKAAIDIAKNPIHHDRTKHVEIDRHFIKEKLEERIIQLTYVPTNYYYRMYISIKQDSLILGIA